MAWRTAGKVSSGVFFLRGIVRYMVRLYVVCVRVHVWVPGAFVGCSLFYFFYFFGFHER